MASRFSIRLLRAISEQPLLPLRALMAGMMLWIALPPAPADAQAPPTAGGTLQDQIDRLIEKADPANDDWQTEQLQSAAGKQLKALGHVLHDGHWEPAALGAMVASEATSSVLRPDRLKQTAFPGGLRVARLEGQDTPAPNTMTVHAALQALVAPLGPARFKFKIVGVALNDAGTCTTNVRYESAGRPDDRTVQQTANWQIDWDPQDPKHPVIQRIRLQAFQEIQAPHPSFTDCTGWVLGANTVWQEQLRRGADYWYGKIDAVGELNFMGHQGIAIGDVNGDGLEDLYVAQSTGLPNYLLVRQPDGTVRDTAAEAGVAWLDDTKGVLFADMDNDGDQDLLCAIGPTIVLCQNNGAGRFGNFVSMRAATPASFYSLAVADYDLDGDLDIYGCRYVKVRYGISVPLPFHDANNGPSNHLLRNEGGNRFIDVTNAVGLGVNNTRFSLAAAWADYDDDGDADLYVANDFGRNNLYRNDGGVFVDVADRAGVQDQAAGMGVSWSDFDGDGDLDLHVSNMFSSAGRRIAYQSRFQADAPVSQRVGIQQHSLGNTLLVNQGDGTFRDQSDQAGIRMGRWAWGARFVDFNNDGYDDIVVPNGFLTNAQADDL